MLLPDLLGGNRPVLWMDQIRLLMEMNEELGEEGLVLSQKEAGEILQERNRVLQHCDRIELEVELTRKLMRTFAASPFVHQGNFVSVLHDLHEIFYFLKNETEDQLPDDTVIARLKELFDGLCEGSVEMLRGQGLEVFMERYRKEITAKGL